MLELTVTVTVVAAEPTAPPKTPIQEQALAYCPCDVQAEAYVGTPLGSTARLNTGARVVVASTLVVIVVEIVAVRVDRIVVVAELVLAVRIVTVLDFVVPIVVNFVVGMVRVTVTVAMLTVEARND
jgi:hypothetical protein